MALDAKDYPRVLHLEDLPHGYYRSVKFIASIAGVCLMAISLYLGFVLPVRPQFLECAWRQV